MHSSGRLPRTLRPQSQRTPNHSLLPSLPPHLHPQTPPSLSPSPSLLSQVCPAHPSTTTPTIPSRPNHWPHTTAPRHPLQPSHPPLSADTTQISPPRSPPSSSSALIPPLIPPRGLVNSGLRSAPLWAWIFLVALPHAPIPSIVFALALVTPSPSSESPLENSGAAASSSQKKSRSSDLRPLPVGFLNLLPSHPFLTIPHQRSLLPKGLSSSSRSSPNVVYYSTSTMLAPSSKVNKLKRRLCTKCSSTSPLNEA